MSALIPYSDFSDRPVVPINPFWLKPVHVDSCLVSVHCPELLTRSGNGALHKALCLQLKHSVFILRSGERKRGDLLCRSPNTRQVQAKEKMSW